jgi:hypothetical protein
MCHGCQILIRLSDIVKYLDKVFPNMRLVRTRERKGHPHDVPNFSDIEVDSIVEFSRPPLE